MSCEGCEDDRILILGIGNTLLGDDGFGVHVTERLRGGAAMGTNVFVCDGGTIGLSLLSEIEDADRLIVIDAGELKVPPGELRVFEGREMDDHLSRNGGTVHEVSMTDILQAARLTGREPRDRALIVVQPELVTWADAPTPRVAAAIDGACSAVGEIVARWRR